MTTVENKKMNMGGNSPTSPTSPTTVLPPAQESLASAKETLAEVARTANELSAKMLTDAAEALALHSVALAASANLSPENIASLARAIRQGRLPRRKATV